MARRQRRSFSPEFRYEAANLVAEQGYSYAEASRAVDVHENTIRNWVQQLESEQDGQTPKSKAMTAERQQIQELEAHVRWLERRRFSSSRILSCSAALWFARHRALLNPFIHCRMTHIHCFGSFPNTVVLIGHQWAALSRN